MSKTLSGGWSQIEDWEDVELLVHEPMTLDQESLWSGILRAHAAGDIEKMMFLVGVFEHGLTNGKIIPGILTTFGMLDIGVLGLSHFGLSL
jgi:hypothetical protein